MLVSADGGFDTGTRFSGIVVPGGIEYFDVAKS